MVFSSNLEADYQADLGPEKIRSLKQAYSLGIFLYTAFAVLDYWAIPSAYHEVWAIRSLVVLMTFAVICVAKWRPRTILSRYTSIMWTTYLIWGYGILAMIALAQRNEMAWSGYYCGVMLACTAFPLTYLSVRPVLALGIAYVGGYLGVAIWGQGMLKSGQWPLLLMNCFFLISSNFAGVIVVLIRERYSREIYLLRRALHRDMELAKEAKRQSDFLAEHDLLTGMPNRIFFMRRLEAMIKHARENNTVVAIHFVDLDGFKPINDNYGHRIGDIVLTVVSERFLACIRGADPVARLGGDEFVVAMELETKHLYAVERLRRDLETAIASPMAIEGSKLSVTSSIGTAMFPADADDAAELIHVADMRMYEIKREKNAASSPATPEQAERNFGIAMDMGIPQAGGLPILPTTSH